MNALVKANFNLNYKFGSPHLWRYHNSNFDVAGRGVSSAATVKEQQSRGIVKASRRHDHNDPHLSVHFLGPRVQRRPIVYSILLAILVSHLCNLPIESVYCPVMVNEN